MLKGLNKKFKITGIWDSECWLYYIFFRISRFVDLFRKVFWSILDQEQI